MLIQCNKSVDAAKALCAELGDAEYFCADLTQKSGVEALFAAVGTPDVLVNNAGIALVKPFDTVKADEEEALYSLDLLAPVRLARLCAPAMISRKSGCIINISSVFGESGGSCEVDYSAAKAGLIGFTKALAKELGPCGVRVNCICPGVIDTEMNSMLDDATRDALSDQTPLCRLGNAEEVADAIFFLSEDTSSFITGQILGVNGGFIT